MFLAAMVLVFGINGQAMAYFTSGDLIQVVLQTNGTGNTEIATDLGQISSMGGLTTAYSGPTISFNTNDFPAAGTGAFAASSWGDLKVAYFVLGSTGNYVWTSGPTTGQTSGAHQYSNFQAGAQNVMSKYASLGSGAQNQLVQSDVQSFYTKMDKGIGSGTMGGFIPAGNADQNLAALATTGYVDQYLYYYSSTGSANAGVMVADIRTFADGRARESGDPRQG